MGHVAVDRNTKSCTCIAASQGKNRKETKHAFPNNAKHFWDSSFNFLSILIFRFEIQTPALLLPKRKLILHEKLN